MFRLSRRAEQDLLEIAQYTLHAWGHAQALRYVDDLEACCQTLAENSGLGRRCDDIRSGLRRLEHESHVVFYRPVRNGIRVVRILHQRMLPERHEI